MSFPNVRITGACVLASLSLVVFAGRPAVAEEPTVARMPDSAREFFRELCVECHNAEKQKGKVRLDTIPLEMADVETAERWQKVLGELNSGAMPPEDAKQPTSQQKAGFLEALSKQMVVARKALADSGGVITMRRLNRREYVNTMRDLLDIEVNAFDLPLDETTGSFDTVGSGLFFSSDQFEHYLRLARTALDEAFVKGKRPERQARRIEAEESANKAMRGEEERARKGLARLTEWHKSGKPAREFGLPWDDTDARINETLLRGAENRAIHYLNNPLSRSGALLLRSKQAHEFSFPPDFPLGRYILRARVGFPDFPENETRFVEVGRQGDQGWPGEMKLLGCYPIHGTPAQPQVIDVPVEIQRGGHRVFAIRERRHNSSEGADKQQQYERTNSPMDARRRRPFTNYETLWVDWIEWEGPFVDTWPPRSHASVLGTLELDSNPDPGEEATRSILQSFARKAFRGVEPRAAFLDRLMEHYRERRAAGESFAEALKTPLSITLASPHFLYLVEPSEPPEEPAPERSALSPVSFADLAKKSPKGEVIPVSLGKRIPLTNVELASRLSYFLWAGPPDERLLSYAEAGRLSKIETVSSGYENEVDRMLADDRVQRFIAGFVHQWLHMARLDFFQFNPRLYPKFDGSLREAARREVYQTVRHALDQDLPLGTLLRSDFVVINDLLAEYYGIPGVRGEGFRRVKVPEALPRGGLLGMAAILAMGSDGERSSPVERGAWVLRKLLHDPPPPAPANVPQLSRFGKNLMPAHEILKAHQEQPQCFQCHRKIDPIGMALQNFDAAGIWREQEYTEFYKVFAAIEKKQMFPLEVKGQLPDGTEANGFFGLRDAVAAREEDFARGLVEHLVEYALGRPCGFSDGELVENILKKTKPKGHALRPIIHALVESREFRCK